ncbi:MAG: hypothetical protein FWG50_06370, partial [Kiritimatiellaeota bacterium]|nr:hypothetical protein [Kiritimatiellota bacterium]
KVVARVTAFLALTGLATGCATVQTARNFGGMAVDGGNRPIATVVAENYGYYLFGTIPLISGTPTHPNATSCRLFEETVTLQNNLAMVSQAVKAEKGSQLANVKTTEEWTGAFSLWLVWRKIIFTSAVITN